MDKQASVKLLNLINISTSNNWTLLYQASRDGYRARDFHSKCDGYNNTLVVIKTSKSYIFGGFTTKLWNDTANGSYVTDSNAFLFTLVNPRAMPFKLKVSTPENAIYASNNLGATFGRGKEISISDYADELSSSSFLTYSYYVPEITKTFLLLESYLFFTGSLNFQATEIEVYTTKGKFLELKLK